MYACLAALSIPSFSFFSQIYVKRKQIERRFHFGIWMNYALSQCNSHSGSLSIIIYLTDGNDASAHNYRHL